MKREDKRLFICAQHNLRMSEWPLSLCGHRFYSLGQSCIGIMLLESTQPLDMRHWILGIVMNSAWEQRWTPRDPIICDLCLLRNSMDTADKLKLHGYGYGWIARNKPTVKSIIKQYTPSIAQYKYNKQYNGLSNATIIYGIYCNSAGCCDDASLLLPSFVSYISFFNSLRWFILRKR